MDQQMHRGAVELLMGMIAIPSVSGDEERVANHLREFLTGCGIGYRTHLNNTWAVHPAFVPDRPTVLLNSHIDTVRPTSSWTHPPFTPTLEGSRLVGLGSNDAGGPLVALLFAFRHLLGRDNLPFNLIFSATAEEENSGANGVESILGLLPPIDLAIVGEPTRMSMAIAERGLLVLNCVALGKSGHAARSEGINALYTAIDDIAWFRAFQFPKHSDSLGPVKMTVTQIQAGTQHNVVPDRCEFVVDIRTNDRYTNQQVLDIVQSNVSCQVNPRSLRLNSSSVPPDHPIVRRAQALGLSTYGSPTCSDMAIMPFLSVKIGPGDSARSHTPDEYIHTHELERGIALYIELLEGLVL